MSEASAGKRAGTANTPGQLRHCGFSPFPLVSKATLKRSLPCSYKRNGAMPSWANRCRERPCCSGREERTVSRVLPCSAPQRDTPPLSQPGLCRTPTTSNLPPFPTPCPDSVLHSTCETCPTPPFSGPPLSQNVSGCSEDLRLNL